MAYKIEFEIRTAILTLQNTFESGMWAGFGGGEGENELKLGGIGSTWRQLPTIKNEHVTTNCYVILQKARMKNPLRFLRFLTLSTMLWGSVHAKSQPTQRRENRLFFIWFFDQNVELVIALVCKVYENCSNIEFQLFYQTFVAFF